MAIRLRAALRPLAAACLLAAAGCTTTLTPSIPQHNFGNVYLGVTAISPGVTWNNVSQGNETVTGLVVFPLGGPFDRPAAGPFTAFTLAPAAASAPFTFTFTPAQAGQATGQASPQVVTSFPDNPPLQLIGTGVAQVAGGVLAIGGGNLAVNQALDFGRVLVPGGAPVTRRFNIVNSGNAPITLRVQWSKGGQGFSVAGPAGPITIPALSQVPVTLQFAPAAVGRFNEGVTFVDQANGANLAGTALTGEGAQGG